MISIVNNNLQIGIRLKRINWGLVFLFLLLWVIVGFNTEMSDTGNYLIFYKYACAGMRYPGIEYGFYLFMRICAIGGMDYLGFLKVYSFVALFIIIKSVDAYSKKPLKCIWLFLFFPFFHIIVAVRNFMSCAIVIYSMRFLWNEKKQKRNAILYIIGIVLAASFHTASLFYLLYLVVYFREEYIYRIVISVVSVGVVFIVFGKKIFPLLISIFPKLNVYLAIGLDGTRFSTKLFLSIFYVASLFFCYELKPYIFSKASYIMRQVIALSSFILVLSLFNMNFMRLQYNIMIIFSTYVFNTIEEAKENGVYNNNMKNICYMYYIFYFIAGFFLLYLYSFESIVLTVLQNNSLF